MKDIIVAAMACIENGKLFIAKRHQGGENGGKWELPGGKLEKGESGKEAIVREIGEELGTKIHVEGEIGMVTHQYGDFFLTMHVYRCSKGQEPFHLSEHTASRWVDAGEIPSVDLAPADRKAMALVYPLLKPQ